MRRPGIRLAIFRATTLLWHCAGSLHTHMMATTLLFTSSDN